jgi:8-oxo-dGTP pyrophosphatase MutT (NUDIX family)
LYVYHTFDSKNGGYDPAKTNFNSGVWATTETIGHNPMNPNEFGDKVVQFRLKPDAKVFEADEQQDAIGKLFSGEEKDRLMEKVENPIGKKDWQDVDEAIGKELRRRGYQVIHHTHDELLGDAWAILDPMVITKLDYDPKKISNKKCGESGTADGNVCHVGEGESGPANAAATVVMHNGKALILKRGPTAPWHPNEWNLPGGTIDKGEHPRSTAMRESGEEIGIQPKNIQYHSSSKWAHFYTATSDSDKVDLPTTNGIKENVEYAWVGLEDLGKYKFVPSVKETLTKVLSQNPNPIKPPKVVGIGLSAAKAMDLAKSHAQALFGGTEANVALRKAALLGGAIPGDRVRVNVSGAGLEVWTSGKGYASIVTVPKEGASARLDQLIVTEPGHHAGTKLFSRIVDAMAGSRITQIDMEAKGGDPAWQGYYVWPRLGAEQEHDDPVIEAKAKDAGFVAHRVQDLMDTQEHRDFWKKNGHTVDVTFSLDKSSKSARVFDAYRKAIGI